MAGDWTDPVTRWEVERRLNRLGLALAPQAIEEICGALVAYQSLALRLHAIEPGPEVELAAHFDPRPDRR